MRALYLTYDGLTDQLGQSQVLPYIIGLSKKINFTIISFEKQKAFETQQNTIEQIINNNKIKWKPQKYTKTPPFLSTLYDIYQLKKAVKNEIVTEEISIIHCRSYITALIGLWAKKKYSIPFIFDMRGFWADERIDGNIWDLNNWIHKRAYNYFKRKEKELLQKADYTISLTNAGKKEIESWSLNQQSPIKVIPCCTDENLFNLSNVEEKRKELKLNENDFVISYLGSIGTWYMLDEMLCFFHEFLKENKHAKFLFITKENKKHILKQAKEKKIPVGNLIVISAPRKEIPSYIKASNLSIFFIKPLYSKTASSPTKMGEILNMGVPIVCNSGIGDVDEIMKRTAPDLLVEELSQHEYQKLIKALPDIMASIKPQDLINFSTDVFSLKQGIAKYTEVYDSILE